MPTPYYRRAARKPAGHGRVIRIIAIVAVAAVVITGCGIFGPRLIHRCDNCDKTFFGTGYYANVLSDALASLHGSDGKILCRACAETNHALEILAGKSLDDFKRPLFG